MQDWLTSPSEMEAGRVPELNACTVQGVLQLLQTLYAIMEQSSPSSYRNGQYQPFTLPVSRLLLIDPKVHFARSFY